MGDRPVIKYVRGQDPERSLEDPSIAMLAAAGWQVGAWMVVEAPGPSGPETQLMLILWPPKKAEPAEIALRAPAQAMTATTLSSMLSLFLLAVLIALAMYLSASAS